LDVLLRTVHSLHDNPPDLQTVENKKTQSQANTVHNQDLKTHKEGPARKGRKRRRKRGCKKWRGMSQEDISLNFLLSVPGRKE